MGVHGVFSNGMNLCSRILSSNLNPCCFTDPIFLHPARNQWDRPKSMHNVKTVLTRLTQSNSVNTRNKDKLDIPLYNSASGQRTFHYRAVSIWNELPNHIKDIDTLDRFKLEYKRHLLHGFLESSS